MIRTAARMLRALARAARVSAGKSAARALFTPTLTEPLERRTLLSGPGPLVISEFMADSSAGLADENLEFSDWIEIRNPTAGTLNADGYYLTDDPALLTKWRIPTLNIPANGQATIFASDKDRTTPRLHTNFKLDKGGEYLALVLPDGVTVADEYAPEYPNQVENVSYGVLNGVERYFTTPTPGAPNVGGSTGLVSDTVFSVDRGFFDTAFELRIATETAGAEIRYTTNGTKPTATVGAVYSGPIWIDHTSTIRAAAFKPGLVPSDVDTQTYLFLDDVIQQTYSSTIAGGFPTSWGSLVPDYGLDDTILSAHADTIKDDFKSIPTLSVVLPVADMFGPNGIYTNSTQRGDAWERATSVELIDPHSAPGDGDTEFQVNAGIQIQGGAFRGDGLTKKHSFRLLFKDKWGVSKLDFPLMGPDSTDSFDSVTLRSDANDGWQWSGAGGRALYARDQWSRIAQREMGQPGSDGSRVHLYINGVYWGIYNPTERPDAAWAADYIGGDKEQWDVLNQDGVTDGNSTAWNQMISLATAVSTAATEDLRTAAYQRIQGNNPDGTDNPAFQDYLDVDNLIDYMVLNIFTGNEDWPHRNWYAGRLRIDNGVGTDATGFKFFSWDAESALDLWATVNSNRTGVNQGPAQPYSLLRSSAAFRQRFAERVQTHMFGNGALSTANNRERMARITAEIDRAIVAESARWGDQHQTPGHTPEEWAAERDRMVNGTYFDQRWGIVLGQLRAAGLYGAIEAPNYSVGSGQVPPGTQVTLTGGSGTVYYTLDGSDPRLPDGTVNPAATGVVTGGATLVARGSVWKYLDNGTNQGTAWKETTFDDSTWASGTAQLGYGDGDETTVVGFGPDSANKYVTTYFRRTFNVANPAQLSALRLTVSRDDGAVVYLNGQEIGRNNMPGGAITSTTFAASVVEDGQFEIPIDRSQLRAGANVFAVEMHQANGGSTDISFDLELVAPAPPVTVTLPGSFPGGMLRLRSCRRDASGNWSALSEAVYYTDAAASAGSLVVTEVNYNPRPAEAALGESAADPGDFEFVELMNRSSQRIVLDGASFAFGIKVEFPLGTFLDPGGRAVVVKNLAAFRSRYGPGPRVLGAFTGSLDNDGQLTFLHDVRNQLLGSFRYNDSGDWPNRADGGGATLEVIDPAGDYNDPDNWRSSREFHGTPGSAGSGPVPGVVVNEVLTNTDAPDLDSVELFNPSPSAADLSGWYLSDSAADYRRYRIPDGTTIAAGGYLLLTETTLGFALDGEGDDVWLMQADPATHRLTRFVDRVELGAIATGESWARWPSGSPDASLYPAGPRTLGSENTGVRVGPVVINEVLYDPAAGGQEFVELRNLTSADVSLAGWRFADGIDYTFPDGTVIAAQGYLLLVGGDPAEFRAANTVPDEVPVLGPFSVEGFLNVLDNAGEKLRLVYPGETAGGAAGTWYEAERLTYGNAAPWPAPTAGASLSRLDPRAWADAASNWANEPGGGSPGRANFGGVVAAPTVFARHAFHNNSAADGRSATAGVLDDYALATATALLPGQSASASNLTNDTRGLNGIFVDVARLPLAAALTAADFDVRFGTGGAWSAPLAPSSITLRRGAGTGGSDRVTLTLPDGIARNTWLRVTVNPTARTGLSSADVFYFGNLVGDAGFDRGAPTVNATDLARTRAAVGRADPASLATFDFNRDGAIDAQDVLTARTSQRHSLSLLTAPAAQAAAGSRTPVGSPVPVPPVRPLRQPATRGLLAEPPPPTLI